MVRGERSCCLCTKIYKYCPDCSGTVKKGETWRMLYCSENCRDIFNVLSQKAFGHIGNEEAAERLSKLDITKRAQFRQDLKDQVNSILSSVKKEETESVPVKEEPKTFQKKRQKKIVNDEYNDEKLSY